MESFFNIFAWTMATPVPYSAFHIFISITGLFLAAAGAFLVSSRLPCSWVLFFAGVFLAVTEVLKQGFLYYIQGQRHFDWWYFPFQLCSIPMYLCLLYPFVSSRLQNVFRTFMEDFGLLGGIMALAEPTGFLTSYWFLTLHGFIWHFILVFLGLFSFFDRKKHGHNKSAAAFHQLMPLFLFCCIIATGINIWAGPEGNADMFYISPYYPSLQPVFHQAALIIGIIPGNLLYLAAACLGAYIIHRFLIFVSSN